MQIISAAGGRHTGNIKCHKNAREKLLSIAVSRAQNGDDMKSIVCTGCVLMCLWLAASCSVSNTPALTVPLPRAPTASVTAQFVEQTRMPTQIVTTASPTATNVPIQNAEVVIDSEAYGKTVTVKIGQTISLASPSTQMEWHVTFDDAHLTLLSPQNPNATGISKWLFRAETAGSSEIVLTSRPTPCPPPTLCPPMPARFAVTVSVIE